MATTLTASLAYSGVQPKGVHTGATLTGKWEGAGLSLSGSGMLLMAKVPYGAKNIMLLEHHELNGAATNVMNFGVRHGASASTSFSALGADLAAITNLGKPYTPAFEGAGGESFKYVVGTHVSGTVTASLNIYYSVTYDFD